MHDEKTLETDCPANNSSALNCSVRRSSPNRCFLPHSCFQTLLLLFLASLASPGLTQSFYNNQPSFYRPYYRNAREGTSSSDAAEEAQPVVSYTTTTTTTTPAPPPPPPPPQPPAPKAEPRAYPPRRQSYPNPAPAPPPTPSYPQPSPPAPHQPEENLGPVSYSFEWKVSTRVVFL